MSTSQNLEVPKKKEISTTRNNFQQSRLLT